MYSLDIEKNLAVEPHCDLSVLVLASVLLSVAEAFHGSSALAQDRYKRQLEDSDISAIPFGRRARNLVSA
jgi:hypothetical protein